MKKGYEGMNIEELFIIYLDLQTERMQIGRDFYGGLGMDGLHKTIMIEEVDRLEKQIGHLKELMRGGGDVA